MAGCGFLDVTCKGKEWIASSIGDAVQKVADAILEGVGKVLASLGTMWVNIGTPNLTGGGGASGVNPGDHAANTAGINTVLGYATWVAFGICVLSLIVVGARMGIGHRHESRQHVDRLGVVLVATIIISAAVGLVTAIAPAVRSNGSPAVAFIQDSLWWYMIAVAVVGVIFGAGRMAWEQRAEPGKDLVKSLLTLVVVSGAGLTAVSLLTAAGDSFSVWLLNGSLRCDVGSDGSCFAGNIATLLALTTTPSTGGLGAILIIVLGLFAILGSIVQILLMIVRAGMLVVLAGVLPVSAAATNTETGRNMFRKSAGWMLAFVLYKPAAAIVYATAFKLSGINIFKDDGSGLISVITGLTLMAVALVALPALMSLIVPAVSSVASGSGMAMAAAAGAAMMPSGAVAAGRLMGGGQGGDSGSGGSGPSPSTPPTGATTTGPSGGPGPSGGGGSTGGPGPGGANGVGATPAGGSTGATAASGGAGAGAAAGPAGAVAGAAVQAVTGTVKAATGAVQQAADSNAGGPNGSK